MQKRIFFKRLFVGLLLAIIVCMGVVIYQLQASLHAVQTALGDNQRISVLEQAVSDNYYESVDDSKLMDGALKGYISALDDPYSGYLTNEEYHQWQSNEAGVSVGIGVTVTLTEDESGLQIVSVENPSPAKLAGLQADDVITAVDGETVANLGYQEAVSHVRGEADTSVELTIQRGKTELKKTVQRQEMQVTSAYGTMLENKIDRKSVV